MSEKLQTLEEQAKKKKDFLIIAAILVIVGLAVFSLGSVFLSFNKEKIYRAKLNKKANAKDLELINKQDFKETWAISIENTLEKQSEFLKTMQKEQKEGLKKVKEELSNTIAEQTVKLNKKIDNTNKTLNEKIEKLKKDFNEKLKREQNRIEEVSLMKGNSGSGIGGGLDTKPVDLNEADLLPDIPNKNNQPQQNNSLNKQEKGGVDLLEKMLSQDINKNNKVNVKNGKSTIINDNTKTEKPVEIVKPKLISIDTHSNKKMVINLEKKKLMLKKLKKQKRKMSYHIMTGLTQAYMITGAYAPAFSAGETDPLPVLLQAEGNILIANDDTETIDKCMLIGSARGNMNSQTVDIRLTSISCSLNGGTKKIEGSISGWVIGENGIPGVQGVLLHKNGAWLARTFTAGFLNTFAKAFSGVASKPTPVPLTSSNFGSAVGDNSKQALGGGLSTVFGKLGEYYLKMAKQIFPVIEVKGGRTVDILLKGGEDLKVTDFNKADLNKIQDDISINEELERKTKELNSEIKVDAINNKGFTTTNVTTIANKQMNNNSNSVKQKKSLYDKIKENKKQQPSDDELLLNN